MTKKATAKKTDNDLNDNNQNDNNKKYLVENDSIESDNVENGYVTNALSMTTTRIQIRNENDSLDNKEMIICSLNAIWSNIDFKRLIEQYSFR